MDTTILTVLNKMGEIGSLALGEYQRLAAVDGQVDNLRSALKFWMAWIQTAEEGNITRRDELVRVWVRQIRGAVFKAEDIVDKYFQEVYQSRPGFESRKGAWSCIPCVPCFSLSQVPLRYDLDKQIEELLGHLEELKKNSFLDMQERVVGQANNIEAFDKPTMVTLALQQLRRTEDVIGFDDYTNYIASVLLNNNGKRGAIVMGVSGIGKTAAARAVFRDWDVHRHFDVCAWVCLPPKSRVDRYLDQIWEQAQEQTHCGSPRREYDVKQVLAKMKLLVVLDGMDNKEELMEILRELPDGTNGSRTVVTTELPREEIEQLIRDYAPVEIKCLRRADCEELLDTMFSGRCSDVYKKHKKYFDDKIYEISGGLPLGVILLGGLLYFKDHEKQWTDVFDQLKSYEGMRLIKRILTLSYVTMPTILKLCFLYFAAMPPNVDLDLKKLHRLWCAEGIPQSESRGDLTEKMVLDRCVRVLVSLGLVQRVDAGTKVCIHQTVHRFATNIAHETGFMEFHSKFDIYDASIVRGLSVRNYDERHVRMDSFFPKLRTLLGDFAEDTAHASWSRSSSTKGLRQSSLLKNQGLKQSRMQFLCQSKFVRVVDLQGVELGTLPDSIGNMVHLRYFGLRSCCLKDLPPSVAKLLNLETLDISDNAVKKIVDDFWKIKKLKHVLAEKLSLPVSAATMDSVTELQTLQGVILSSQWTQQNCPVTNMSKLFSLAVVGATASNVGPLAKALEEKRELRQLKIQGDRIPQLCSSRYPTLEYLELDGMILSREGAAKSPDSCYPITASRIVLKSSCMSQKLLDTFLTKSSLTELELLDNSFSESKLLLRRNTFTDLTKLKLGNLKALEELVMEESALPRLVTLEIYGCPNMKTIQGLKYSEELKMVVLFDMPAVAAQIEAENRKLVNKIKHVTSGALASAT